MVIFFFFLFFLCFFFKAEDGIRDLVRSRGLGDGYKRQVPHAIGSGEIHFGRGLRPAREQVIQGGNGAVQ